MTAIYLCDDCGARHHSPDHTCAPKVDQAAVAARRRYTYNVEVVFDEGWAVIIDSETRDFCLGYHTSHRQHPGPRLETRVVRSDGKVVEAAGALDRASLGMVAGFPTPETYERAAAHAQSCADEIRLRAKARAERGLK